MRSLSRWLRPTGSGSTITFCEACGQACTPACRAAARLERDRTAALRLALPR